MSNFYRERALDREREAFEAWAKPRYATQDWGFNRTDGEYYHQTVQALWDCWQQSAAEPRTEFICGGCMLRKNARTATNEPAF